MAINLSLATVACIASICFAQTANETNCGCKPNDETNLYGPSRGRGSVAQSLQLPPFRTSTDSDIIRIDDMLIPRAEFERAASPGTGRFSSPSDYINCVGLWPNGVLRYRFDTNYPDESKSLVRKSLENLKLRTDNVVNFVEEESSTSQVHVKIVNSVGCLSFVGKLSSEFPQEMSLNVPGCMVQGMIQHEFIHALGFYHEHTRIDRDKYVDIYWENIRSDLCKYFYKDFLQIPHDFPGYDYESIMHYSARAFSCSSKPTMLAKNTTVGVDEVLMGSLSLSDKDIAKLKYVYSKRNLEYCLATTTSLPVSLASTLHVSFCSWILVVIVGAAAVLLVVRA